MPQQFRWQELCGSEAGGARHVPLDRSDDAWLTIGGELRDRTETIDNPELGLRDGRGYTATDIRALLQADLRTAAGPRAFVQLSAAADVGRPIPRPFDESAPDVQQAFVDLPVRIGRSTLTVRVGRQEVDLGGNRLVANRDPANLRLAFDMVLGRLDWAHGSATAFVGRPVLDGPRAFDDHGDRSDTFTGVDLELGRGDAPLTGAVFGFYRDHQTTLQSVTGRDRRATIGGRLVWRGAGGLDAQGQMVHQFGSAEGLRIAADGLTGEVGWTWRSTAWRPRVAVVAGYASGDRSPTDGRVGDFDPLYPRLGYFTEAPALYPRNVWDVAPNLKVAPTGRLSIEAGVVIISRLHSLDALYSASGRPLADAGPYAGVAATLPFAYVRWTISEHLTADASAVVGRPGPALTSGASSPFTYGLAQLSYRF